MSPYFILPRPGNLFLMSTRCLILKSDQWSHRQSSLWYSVSRLRPAALLMLAFLGLIDESLHQSHQLLLSNVLATETLLESWAALVQGEWSHDAGDVHHTALKIQKRCWRFFQCETKMPLWNVVKRKWKKLVATTFHEKKENKFLSFF